MKKKLVKNIIILLTVCGLAACSGAELPIAEDKHPSFQKLEEMPEITVEGNIVTVALLQDIPLPYRWAVTGQSECATLIEEYEAENPYDSSLFSVGSAFEYHVFTFELSGTDVAELQFHNLHVTEPENLDEANGNRSFILEHTNGQWKVIVAESSN